MLVDNKKFNNIKIHTQYSICEGAIKIDDLAECCKKNNRYFPNFYGRKNKLVLSLILHSLLLQKNGKLNL